MTTDDVTTNTEVAENPVVDAEKFFNQEVKKKEPVVETPEVVKEDVEKPTEELKPEGEIALKLPDGAQIEQAEVDEVLAMAKENSLTQEQAQKILDARLNSVDLFTKRIQEKHEIQVKQWASDIKSDKELGGDKYTETVSLARRALDKFASPDLKKILDDSGYGNHPELVRVFARVGKTLQDSKLVQAPGSKAAKTSSLESKFYPEMTQE
jgi:hypothetical protein